jgi:hypothetical protein
MFSSSTALAYSPKAPCPPALRGAPHPRAHLHRESIRPPNLAHDVAHDPAEIGADRLQRPVGALELFGMRVTLMGDQRMLADTLVGLAQLDAELPGQLRQSLARPCINLASVGKATALGCMVVSTMTLEKSAGFAAPVRVWRPPGSPGSTQPAAPRPSAGASASAMSGRRSACAGRALRRRTAGSRGSRSSAHTDARRRDRACA